MIGDDLMAGDVITSHVCDELIRICSKTIDLLTTGYTYSLRNLLADLSNYLLDLPNDVSREYSTKLSVYDKLVEFAGFHLFYSLCEILSVLKAGREKISKSDAERVIKSITSPFSKLTCEVINEFAVEFVRTLREVEASFYDNYNAFRDKWNALIIDIERD